MVDQQAPKKERDLRRKLEALGFDLDYCVPKHMRNDIQLVIAANKPFADLLSKE